MNGIATSKVESDVTAPSVGVLFSSFLFTGWADCVIMSIYVNFLLLPAFRTIGPPPHSDSKQQIAVRTDTAQC